MILASFLIFLGIFAFGYWTFRQATTLDVQIFAMVIEIGSGIMLIAIGIMWAIGMKA